MGKKRSESFKDNLVVLVFGALFLLSVFLLVGSSIRTTGYATTSTTTSNVTISTYFAIDMSTNLSQGIQFGTISSLPATNQNATHNYDGVNTTDQGFYTNATNGTSMWMNVSVDSNSAVDFCIYGHTLNTSTADEILVGNETYYNDTDTNVTIPDVGSEVALTGSYVKSGSNIAAGSANYYRFWLDVPAATATGVYNNTVFFEGVATGGACT